MFKTISASWHVLWLLCSESVLAYRNLRHPLMFHYTKAGQCAMLANEAENLPSKTLPTISKRLLHQVLSMNDDVAHPVQEGCGHDVQVDSKRLMPVLHALHLAGGTAQLQDVKVILRFEISILMWRRNDQCSHETMHLLASQCVLGKAEITVHNE